MKSNLRQPSKTSALQQLKDANFPIESVLDVGIHLATYELIKAFPDKKQFLFEPIEEHYETIEKNYKKNNIDFELNKVAVSNADGTAELRVSSVNNTQNITHARFADANAPQQTLRRVPTLKLDTFVAKQNPPAPYLLKIDVDGAEELILEGAQEALKNCSVLILESPRRKLLERLKIATAAGFELLEIVDFCYYSGYLAQVDLVFINPNFASPDYLDAFKGGFSIDKWHNLEERKDKRPAPEMQPNKQHVPEERKDDHPKRKKRSVLKRLSRSIKKRI